MVGFLVSVLVLQVYFLSPLKILIVTTTCVSIIALGMLTGKANIPSVPFGKWIFLFMVVFLISGILNQVDLISFAISWALIFVPPIVCLSIVALRPRRIVVDRLITSNALCVILQIIVLLVQSLLEGRLLWEDAVAGTISRRGVNSHTPGVVMMLNGFIYAFLYRATGRKFFALTFLSAFSFWILSSTGHSFIAFVAGVCLFALLRSRSFIVCAKVAVAIWCFAIIVERTQTGVYKQLTWYVREIFSGEIDHLSGIGKFKLYQNTFSLFEEAQRPIFGVGPGNYNSRVAYAKKGNYLTSGYFNRVEYGFLPPQSEYTRKYVHVHKVVGVRNSPLASLVSILAEYGFAGLVVFLLYGASVYRYLGKLSMMGDETGSSLALGLQLGSAVILFLFFLEAWLEYPKVMILYWSFVALCIVCSREPAREQTRDALT